MSLPYQLNEEGGAGQSNVIPPSRVAALTGLLGRLRNGQKHLKNVASFMVARVAAIVLYLAPVPLFISKQGAAAYGTLGLLLLVFSYLHVFDLGIGYAVNQRLARSLARDNQRGIDVIRYAVPVFLVCALLVSSAMFLGARPIAVFLTGKAEHVAALRVLAIAVGFLMSSALLTAVMQAYNRVDWINYSRLIIDVARALGLFVGAFAADGIAVAVAFTVGGSIIKTVVDGGLAVRLLGSVTALRPRFRIRELVVNVRLGLPMVVSVVLGMLMTSADRVFVGRRFGQDALAHYSVAADVCSRAYFIVWAVTGSIYTLYVKRRAVRRSANDLIHASMVSVFVVAALFYLPLALFARQIIGLWLGSAFAQSSVGVTRIWAAAAVAYLLMCVYYNHLQGFGRPRMLALSGVLGFAVLIAGLFSLSTPFGIEGAALSVLAGFSTQAIFLWSLSRRMSSKVLS